jgi:hypothetical protein
VRGSSLVGTSPLLPPAACEPSGYSTIGSGGSVCTGYVFRRMWFAIASPAQWVGKALCVRPPWSGVMNTCQSLEATCNCLPYLQTSWKGNVFQAMFSWRQWGFATTSRFVICLYGIKSASTPNFKIHLELQFSCNVSLLCGRARRPQHAFSSKR